MSVYAIIFLIGVLVNLSLGFIVYLSDRKKIINRIFFVLVLCVVQWIVSIYLLWSSENNEIAFMWGKLSFLGPTFIPALLICFSYLFPTSLKKLSIKWIIILFIPSLTVCYAVLADFIIKGAEITPWGVEIALGKFFIIFPIYFLTYLFYSLYLLGMQYRKNTGVQLLQVKYLFFGFLLSAFLGLLINVIIPIFGIGRFVGYGPLTTIVFVSFTTYAITKHHLFNIKIIATELLTFAIWIFLLAQTLLADSLRNQLLNGALLLLVVVFGTLLIKSVIREVEQREKLETLSKELGAANDRLVKLDQLKSQFLSFASHQVKTPITVVKGYASLIGDGTYGVVSPKIKEVASKIIDASDRMVSLVNNILNLRKIEEGKMEYKFSEIDVVNLVRNVASELRSIAEKKNLSLKVDLPEEELAVKADEEKLRQVIQNLIDNAIKYTEKGWIEAGVEKEDGSVIISVSDSGRGVSKELLPKLFEQWTRDSTVAKEIQGTGLGLYIAKEIVSAHNGEIWAESRGEGTGSTFYVRLKLSDRVV